jgi:hypothetical protein
MSVFSDKLVRELVTIAQKAAPAKKLMPNQDVVKQPDTDNSDLINMDNSDLIGLEQKPTGQPAQPAQQTPADKERADMYAATGDPEYAPNSPGAEHRSPQEATNVMKNPSVVSMQNAIIELVDLLENQAVQKTHALGVLMSDEGKKYIEQMRHLGRNAGRGDETKADGMWEDKTNRSLGYASQIGSAILRLADQYKIDTGKFNYQELNSFAVQIPKDWKKADLPKLAPVMEKYIREIMDMINRFNADPNANQAAGTAAGGTGQGQGQPAQPAQPGSGEPAQQGGNQGQNQGQGDASTKMTEAVISAIGGAPLGDPLYLDRIEQFFNLVGGEGGWLVKYNDQMVQNLAAIYNTKAATKPGESNPVIQRRLNELSQTVGEARDKLDQIRNTWVKKTTINADDAGGMGGSNPATVFKERVMKSGMQDVDGRNCAIMINEVLSLVIQILQALGLTNTMISQQQQIANTWTGRFNKIAQLLY